MTDDKPEVGSGSVKLTHYPIARAELEIGRLRDQMTNRGLSIAEAELLRGKRKELRDRNLQGSAFRTEG